MKLIRSLFKKAAMVGAVLIGKKVATKAIEVYSDKGAEKKAPAKPRTTKAAAKPRAAAKPKTAAKPKAAKPAVQKAEGNGTATQKAATKPKAAAKPKTAKPRATAKPKAAS